MSEVVHLQWFFLLGCFILTDSCQSLLNDYKSLVIVFW